MCLGELARVVTITETDDDRHARVVVTDLAGTSWRPAATRIPGVAPGDTVLVHNGEIVARVTEPVVTAPPR